MRSGMEKDDNYSATIEAEANRDDKGRRSFQIQDNLDYSSMCHDSKPSSSYDDHDDAMKVAAAAAAAADIDNDIHDGSGGVVMVDYMHNDMIIPNCYQQQQQPNRQEPNNNGNMIADVERTLSFADVMQFALSHNHINIHLPQQHQLLLQDDQEVSSTHTLNPTSSYGRDNSNIIHNNNDDNGTGGTATAILKEMRSGVEFGYSHIEQEEGGTTDAEYIYAPQSTTGLTTNNVVTSDHLYMNNPVQRLEFLGHATTNNNNNNTPTTSDENFIDNINGDKTAVTEGGGGDQLQAGGKSSSSKRKRPRTIKTSDEVESQRMTHIAVERNRRKQMNEHLRVLRSLMPSSYVQRGDQASIIGGAIEFVRELEQLLQCLESQKRRRLYDGDQQSRPNMGDSTSTLAVLAQQPPLSSFPSCPVPPLLTNLEVAPNHHHHHEENDDHHNSTASTAVGGSGLILIQEETAAESKSSIADVEVKVVGFDALIKILSRRRPGQLIKAIAALEDLHFTILHTNITTIDQTVLYSFNVKVGNEARFTAEDIATSVQQIFTYIHGNTNLI